MKSRARCIPLNHQLSHICGVKECPKFNKISSKTNLSTFQEKRRVVDASLVPINKAKILEKVLLPLEGKMFYDFSNKRKMECEKYQDCSWFQQDLIMRKSTKEKLLLAEEAEQIIDTDEFDLAMQFATDHIIAKGETELGFENMFLEECNKLEDLQKNKLFTPHDNFLDNKKLEEKNSYDEVNELFCLKKADSFDNMELISSTHPAEVIPISLVERMQYDNCSLTSLSNTIKNEILNEETLQSPDSTTHVKETDDSVLTIGREETVEENEAEEEICKPGIIHSMEGQLQDPKSLNSNIKKNQSSDCKLQISAFQSVNSDFAEKKILPPTVVKVENEPNTKLDLNLDLPKMNFEPSFGISTPDLDFMDLVDFINEDLHSVQKNNFFTEQKNDVSSSSKNISTPKKTVKRNCSSPNKNIVIQENKTSTTTQENIASNNESAKKDIDKVNKLNISDEETLSIAERIKIKAKRRVARKYVMNSESTSEDIDDDNFELPKEDDQGEDDDDYDDDDDDDYSYEMGSRSKKKCSMVNKNLKISSQMNCNSTKKEKSEYIDSYRERRDRNNEASRRSRQNRKDRERRMFKTLEEEEKRNVKLRAEADVLEKQVTSLRKLLLQVVLRKADGT